MDIWQRARVFAEEAAKKSSEFSKEAAKRSQELTRGAAGIVSETAKKSREFAVEASKKADVIRVEALRCADQIKTLAADLPLPLPTAAVLPTASPGAASGATGEPPAADLVMFGVSEELREFVKGITIDTFRDFPMEDEPEMSDIPTVSNVRQDLNEWQTKHATLVLSTVKEMSKFRYELCPRYMKERKFWRIYFIIVNSYVAPYEKKYMEDLKRKAEEQKQNDRVKDSSSAAAPVKEVELQSKSSTAEQDLDMFLLGDLGSDDEGPDAGDDGLDDDLDKIESTSGLASDDDKGKSKQPNKVTDL